MTAVVRYKPFIINKRVLLFYKCILLIAVLFSTAESVSSETVPPAVFAENLEFQNAKISPDGKHLAFRLIKDNKARLAVVDTETLAPVGGADFGKRQQVGEFYWANNERLVMKVNEFNPWAEFPAYYGELFAVDLDGTAGDIIYGYRASESQIGNLNKGKEAVRGWAEFVSLLPDDPDHILISSEPHSSSQDRQKTLHRLHIKTGKMSSSVAAMPYNTDYVVASDQGDPKLAVGFDAEFNRKVYTYDGREYSEANSLNFDRGFDAVALDPTGQFLYYIDNAESNTSSLYKFNLDTGDKTLVFNDPAVDMTSFRFSDNGANLLAIELDKDYPTFHIVDNTSEEGKIFAQMANTFKGHSVSVTSRSKDGQYSVVHVSHDTVAGQFYLYNKATNKFRLLFKNLSKVPQQYLSQAIPFSFKASDGVEIPAYLTFPVHIPETQDVPMVVLVHGGPGARDYWSYDSEVQMLAAQGYAVLRINFRGSSGYGSDFQNLRKGKWGTRVQQDIIEGTQFVMNSGGIDKEKICIMGGSFGGYSAIMAPTIAPDLFACSVANVGVYDLDLMFTEGSIKDLLYGKAYLIEEIGEDATERQAQSPVNHVSKLTIPLFLAHGGEDTRVPIDHAEALKAQLDKYNKQYDWFYTDNAGHGFFEENSRIAYFEAVAKFLKQHLQ